MLQRQTQTAAFWRDQFEVSADDLEFLYNLLLDAQTTKTQTELATLLVDKVHPLLKQGAAAIAMPWWLSVNCTSGVSAFWRAYS